MDDGDVRTPEEKITQAITHQQVIDIFSKLAEMNVKLDGIMQAERTTTRDLKDLAKRIAVLEQERAVKRGKWGTIEWLWQALYALILAIVGTGVWYSAQQ